MGLEQEGCTKVVPEPVRASLDLMPETAAYRALLQMTALALAVCALLVTLAYFFIDRPVAFFVHNHHLNQVVALRWLTSTAMALDALAAAVVVLAAVRLAWGPLTRLERTFLAASVGLMVTLALEYYLKFLFGRYWPETWVNNNPSLLGDGAYGFHPFHFGAAFGSFPSGHTARTAAVLAAFWVAYPAWRWLYAAIGVSVVVGLVGMNYHFVGDTIGGAFLGAVTGVFAARFMQVNSSPASGKR